MGTVRINHLDQGGLKQVGQEDPSPTLETDCKVLLSKTLSVHL